MIQEHLDPNLATIKPPFKQGSEQVLPCHSIKNFVVLTPPKHEKLCLTGFRQPNPTWFMRQGWPLDKGW